MWKIEINMISHKLLYRKRFKLVIVLIWTRIIINAQDGQQHQVIKFVDGKTVEINNGDQFDVEKGDKFQVFGQAIVIHPATGQLVQKDNVYLGTIRVTEVWLLTSIAGITERKYRIHVGNDIQKEATK